MNSKTKLFINLVVNHQHCLLLGKYCIIELIRFKVTLNNTIKKKLWRRSLREC